VIAYERYTDRAADTVLVLINPGLHEQNTTVLVANSSLMGDNNLVDQLSGTPVPLHAAIVQTRMPAQTAWVLKPRTATPGSYSNYKRVP
jgi:hypothetical protein